jgi:pimeloyl-ACP methyl ester carboxylesterase
VSGVGGATDRAGGADGGAPTREPLLLIHGLGASASVWDPVVPLLEPEREVVVLDMPGFGRAPSLPAGVEPTAAALAAALRDKLADRGIARPHVAGNSLGGWVALELGRMGAARSVTCLSPAGLWRNPLGPRAGEGRLWAQRLRPLAGAALWIEPLRRRAVATTVARPENVPARDGRELVLSWIDAEGYDGANQAMRTHVFDPAGYPPPSEVPVTIAWGERDRLLGPPRPERRPAGAKFIVLPGVGHTPMWDDPELVARTLLDGSSRVGSGETVTSEGGAA